MSAAVWSDLDYSRQDTTHLKTKYLAQLPLGARPGARGWVHQALRLRIAESTADRALVADVVKRRHYLLRWPCPPRTLILSYLADLAGVGAGPAGAAGLVMIALLPGRFHVARALDLHPCSVLSFARSWRADDLNPKVAPDLMPEIVRRVVRGERGRGPLRTLAEEWTARKCRDGGLRAAPRLLCTYADPGVGHDGALYRAAGAAACGPGVGGKLLFAWALDPALKDPLRRLAAAVEERGSAP